MIRKLHNKITLIILIILILFLIIFSFAVNMHNRRILNSSSERTLIKATKSVIELHRIPKINTKLIEDKKLILNKAFRFPRIGYIVRDENLNVIMANKAEQELRLNTYDAAYDTLITREASFTKTTVDDNEYRVYTEYFEKPKNRGIIQVYQNIEGEKGFSFQLIRTFIIIGVPSILALIVISWVLAKFALKPVREAWEQQEKFVADASHELRTPLTVIQANLEIPLEDDNGTIKDNKIWLENAYDETKIMRSLINDLLMLAKIDAKQINITKENFNLSKLSEEAFEQIKPLFNNKNIYSEALIDSDVYITADKQKIRQVLIILLDNAVKYNYENGKVSLKIDKLENKVIIQVSDTGIGIADDDKEHIFDRFYRGDKARTREEGNHGLGLSIAKWIIDEHKGTIKVESELGKGTVMTVELFSNNFS